MIRRRALGLLLAASMLQLNAARADVACATHHRSDTLGPVAASLHHGEHHQDGDAAQPSQSAPASDEQCETPARSDCCRALASCSPLLASADESVAVSIPMVRDLLGTGLSDEPLSSIVAPDPPPPKA